MGVFGGVGCGLGLVGGVVVLFCGYRDLGVFGLCFFFFVREFDFVLFFIKCLVCRGSMVLFGLELFFGV